MLVVGVATVRLRQLLRFAHSSEDGEAHTIPPDICKVPFLVWLGLFRFGEHNGKGTKGVKERYGTADV